MADATLPTNGRIPGIDGMLDQCSEALVRQISADRDLQVRVGTAAGVAVAKTVLAGLFTGWVVQKVWDSLPEK